MDLSYVGIFINGTWALMPLFESVFIHRHGNRVAHSLKIILEFELETKMHDIVVILTPFSMSTTSKI